jgi:hypothetical protein
VGDYPKLIWAFNIYFFLFLDELVSILLTTKPPKQSLQTQQNETAKLHKTATVEANNNSQQQQPKQ